MSKRVLIGISGGIDSAVAAALLKTQGYEVVGLHAATWGGAAEVAGKRGANCCLVSDTKLAKTVCHELEIPLTIVDARERYQSEVIDYVVHEALLGRRPDPCVICNARIKFSALVEKARELRCELVATGHYAKIVRSPGGGETNLYRAADTNADQSGLLFALRHEDLSMALMPLGDLLKPNVRKMARTFRLSAREFEPTQPICFLGGGGYLSFVEKRVAERYRPGGTVMKKDGNVLGRHVGLYRYTIGQPSPEWVEKNEIAGPCVTGFDLKTNAIQIGPEEDLFRREVVATECNWIGRQDFTKGLRARARTRAGSDEAACTVSLLNNNSVLVELDEKQRGFIPGQTIVFYQDELVIGGGWIA